MNGCSKSHLSLSSVVQGGEDLAKQSDKGVLDWVLSHVNRRTMMSWKKQGYEYNVCRYLYGQRQMASTADDQRHTASQYALLR